METVSKNSGLQKVLIDVHCKGSYKTKNMKRETMMKRKNMQGLLLLMDTCFLVNLGENAYTTNHPTIIGSVV